MTDLEKIKIVSSVGMNFLMRFEHGVLEIPGLVGHYASMGMRHVLIEDLPAKAVRDWLDAHADSDMVRSGAIREATADDEQNPGSVLVASPGGDMITLKERQDREAKANDPIAESDLPPTWPAPEVAEGEVPPAAAANIGSAAAPINQTAGGGLQPLSDQDAADTTPVQSEEDKTAKQAAANNVAAATVAPNAADTTAADQAKVDAIDNQVVAKLKEK